MNQKLGINKRVADKLLEHGYIDDADHATSIDFARRKSIRVEEALLQLGVIEEAKLLKYIATLHKTQFVSTERMSKAKIDRQALSTIPRKLASHLAIYPLVLDRRGDKLIIATADPDDADAIKELKLTAGVQRVLPMVARPDAVRAAIVRGYDGDRSVFTQVMRTQVTGFAATLADDDPFEAAAERKRNKRRTGRPPDGSRPGARRRLQRTGPPLTEKLRGRDRTQGRARVTRDAEHWPDFDDHNEARRDRTGSPGETYSPSRSRTGDGRSRTDDGRPRTDDGRPRTDDGRPRTGDPRPRTGDPRPRTGDPRPRTGDPRPRTGDPRPRNGRSTRGRFDSDSGYEDMGRREDMPRRNRRSSSPGEMFPDGRRGSPPPRPPEARYPEPRRAAERGRYPDHYESQQRYPEPGYDQGGYDQPPPPQFESQRHESARHSGSDHDYTTPSPQSSYQAQSSYQVPSSQQSPVSSPKPLQRRRLSLLPPMRAMAVAPSTGFGSLSDRQRSGEAPDLAVVLSSAPYLESLRVLIGLLENDRPHLRAHSTSVARLALSLCERIALPKQHTQAIVLASYLHDLGKMGSHHLTSLNVALFDQHRDLATKLVQIPQQLMESVGLTVETTQALASMYEQMGGGGLPDGLTGKDIPIGARILAVADSFADLTRNAHNAQGALFSGEDAIKLLREYATTVFDPNIIDVLEEAIGGERILTDLLANRHRVLLIDPDPEETMVLQLRMVEQGFDVHVARTVDEAGTALQNHEFALVVSEIDLEQPDDGFTVLQEHAQLAANMSWVFLSGRETRETAERVFKLQADDFLTKPVATEVVVAKLTQLIERQAQRAAPHGVSGSLSQMGLPDIVQILWHGRKTCALVVTSGELEGAIHFSEGQIVNALWGDADGTTAFYRLIAIQEDGNFRVDPAFVPEGEPMIRISPEGLLLEGMRLLDEGAIP